MTVVNDLGAGETLILTALLRDRDQLEPQIRVKITFNERGEGRGLAKTYSL